jgi:hypothetical protein
MKVEGGRVGVMMVVMMVKMKVKVVVRVNSMLTVGCHDGWRVWWRVEGGG